MANEEHRITKPKEVPIPPTKIVQFGGTARPRIAQACDRCRNKKIRCDGIFPHCSNCLHVGIDCKTTHKLSRHAYPKGYAESLERQVATLQAENRELRSLLEESRMAVESLLSPGRRSQRHSLPSPECSTTSSHGSLEHGNTIGATTRATTPALDAQSPFDATFVGAVGTLALDIESVTMDLSSSSNHVGGTVVPSQLQSTFQFTIPTDMNLDYFSIEAHMLAGAYRL